MGRIIKRVLSVLGLALLIVTGFVIATHIRQEEEATNQIVQQKTENTVTEQVHTTNAIGTNEKQTQEAGEEVETKEPQAVYGGLFEEAAYMKAQEMLQMMTLEEKVGQMLLARCPSTGAVESIKTYHLGGFVLFKPDFEGKTKNQVINMTTSFQEAAKIPMTLAVDEEGGMVVRISSNPSLSEIKFKSPMELDSEGGIPTIKEDATKKARLLRELGITMNLAPVADVSTNPNDYIYYRTIGKEAGGVAAYVQAVVEGTQGEGIDSTLKHFPGYGGNVDTHIGVAYDTRTYEALVEKDFIPFQAGIEAGVHSILISHNIVEAIDKEHPASLSPKVISILREVLGFQGIIMTDDLEMEAAKAYLGEVHPAVQAVLAGNDLLIITDYSGGHSEIMKAVESGVIEETQIDEAVLRLLTWKYDEKR